MDKFCGLYCALWTPTDEQGEILWNAVDRQLEFVLSSGVQGIMALGSTGEFVQLSIEQRKVLLERIVGACRQSNRFVIANVSDIRIRNVITLGRHARAIGADCISVLPPWYFHVEQRDLAAFFIQVGREVGMGMAVYNYPEVTGNKIEVATIRQIAREVKVCAIKQSGAEFEYHHDLLRLGQELGVPVLTGGDTRLEEALRLGCSGTISGLANTIPEVFRTIFEKFKTGTDPQAENRIVAGLAEIIAPLPFPFNVKAAIAGRGFETGVPKSPVSEETERMYNQVVANLKDWFSRGMA